jgi:hypothetical protein
MLRGSPADVLLLLLLLCRDVYFCTVPVYIKSVGYNFSDSRPKANPNILEKGALSSGKEPPVPIGWMGAPQSQSGYPGEESFTLRETAPGTHWVEGCTPGPIWISWRRELYSRGKGPRYPLGGRMHPRANLDILDKRALLSGKQPPVPIGWMGAPQGQSGYVFI